MCDACDVRFRVNRERDMTCLERTVEFWWTACGMAAAVVEEAMAKYIKGGLGGGVQRKSDKYTFPSRGSHQLLIPLAIDGLT